MIATAQKCADTQCDLVWRDSHAPTEFVVCMLTVLLCVIWIFVNMRATSIKLKRRHREWDE